jgi:hypothetical protein
MRVVMQPLNPDDALLGIGTSPGPSPLRDDFTFELKTTPGPIGLRIVAQAAAVATAWQLKTIRVNGVDVTDTGIDVGSQGVNGIEIEMTSRLPQLSGTVADARGATVANYAVAIFSQDRPRWTARNAPDGLRPRLSRGRRRIRCEIGRPFGSTRRPKRRDSSIEEEEVEMKTDLYIKFVLTVIAACLVYLCVGGPKLMPAAYAQQQPTRVILAGWTASPNDSELWRLGSNPLPVVQPNVVRQR